MGQRLNIEIMKGGPILTNAYYHRSAYTGSALDMCKDIFGQCEKSSLIRKDLRFRGLLK